MRRRLLSVSLGAAAFGATVASRSTRRQLTTVSLRSNELVKASSKAEPNVLTGLITAISGLTRPTQSHPKPSHKPVLRGHTSDAAASDGLQPYDAAATRASIRQQASLYEDRVRQAANVPNASVHGILSVVRDGWSTGDVAYPGLDALRGRLPARGLHVAVSTLLTRSRRARVAALSMTPPSADDVAAPEAHVLLKTADGVLRDGLAILKPSADAAPITMPPMPALRVEQCRHAIAAVLVAHAQSEHPLQALRLFSILALQYRAKHMLSPPVAEALLLSQLRTWVPNDASTRAAANTWIAGDEELDQIRMLLLRHLGLERPCGRRLRQAIMQHAVGTDLKHWAKANTAFAAHPTRRRLSSMGFYLRRIPRPGRIMRRFLGPPAAAPASATAGMEPLAARIRNHVAGCAHSSNTTDVATWTRYSQLAGRQETTGVYPKWVLYTTTQHGAIASPCDHLLADTHSMTHLTARWLEALRRGGGRLRPRTGPAAMREAELQQRGRGVCGPLWLLGRHAAASVLTVVPRTAADVRALLAGARPAAVAPAEVPPRVYRREGSPIKPPGIECSQGGGSNAERGHATVVSAGVRRLLELGEWQEALELAIAGCQGFCAGQSNVQELLFEVHSLPDSCYTTHMDLLVSALHVQPSTAEDADNLELPMAASVDDSAHLARTLNVFLAEASQTAVETESIGDEALLSCVCAALLHAKHNGVAIHPHACQHVAGYFTAHAREVHAISATQAVKALSQPLAVERLGWRVALRSLLQAGDCGKLVLAWALHSCTGQSEGVASPGLRHSSGADLSDIVVSAGYTLMRSPRAQLHVRLGRVQALLSVLPSELLSDPSFKHRLSRALVSACFAHPAVAKDIAGGQLQRLLALALTAELPFLPHLNRALARHEYVAAKVLRSRAPSGGVRAAAHLRHAELQRVAARDSAFWLGDACVRTRRWLGYLLRAGEPEWRVFAAWEARRRSPCVAEHKIASMSSGETLVDLQHLVGNSSFHAHHMRMLQGKGWVGGVRRQSTACVRFSGSQGTLPSSGTPDLFKKGGVDWVAVAEGRRIDLRLLSEQMVSGDDWVQSTLVARMSELTTGELIDTLRHIRNCDAVVRGIVP